MNKLDNRGFLIISYTITILFIVQIFFSLIFYNWAGMDLLTYIGWIIIIVGVIILYKAQIDFKAVNKMQEHVKIVDAGLFSIVRHPMYLSFMLMAVGLILISQFWAVVIIGVFRVVMIYYVILEEEKMDIDRWGSDYRDYQKRVPRLNFIKAILKDRKG